MKGDYTKADQILTGNNPLADFYLALKRIHLSLTHCLVVNYRMGKKCELVKINIFIK